MLILQVRTHSNSASDAQDSLAAQFHVAVEQILESNHAISVQLRALVVQQTLNGNIASDTTNANAPTDPALLNDDNLVADCDSRTSKPSSSSPKSTPTSPATTFSSAGAWKTSLVAKDRVDAASIRSTATTASMRSFKEALRSSRVYRRVRRQGRNSDSVFSLESSEKGCSWSMFSHLSLGDLSISEISVIELPICLSDLWDATPYLVESRFSSHGKSSASSRAKWPSKGRKYLWSQLSPDEQARQTTPPAEPVDR
jgi:hypothetical protein